MYNAKAEKFNEIEIMTFQHAKEKKEMRKQIKDLKNGIVEADTNKNDETVVFLENELKTQKLTSLSLEKQLSELNRKVSSLEGQLSVSESEAKAKAETADQQAKQLEVERHKNQQLSNNLNALQEAYAGLQTEMERKENEINTQLTMIDEEDLLQTLNTNNTNLTMQMMDSDDHLPKINETRLHNQIEELQAELESLKEQLDERETTIKKGRQSYANMELELGQTKEETSKLRHLLDSKEQHLSKAQEDLDDLKRSQAANNDALSQLRGDLQISQEQTDLLEKDVQSKNKKIRTLQVGNYKIKHTKFSFQEMSDTKNAQLEELKSQLASFQKEMVDQKLALADQQIDGQSEKEEQARRIDSLNSKVIELETSLKENEVKVAEYKEQITELTENIADQNVSFFVIKVIY